MTKCRPKSLLLGKVEKVLLSLKAPVNISTMNMTKKNTKKTVAEALAKTAENEHCSSRVRSVARRLARRLGHDIAPKQAMSILWATIRTEAGA